MEPRGIQRVDPATVNGNTFVLRNSSNKVVAATVTLDSTGTIATLDPTTGLGAAKTFTATVAGGSNGVKDIAEYAKLLGEERVASLGVKQHAYAAQTDFGY